MHPSRLDVVEWVIKNIAEHETLFTDYERMCEDRCFRCDQCIARLRDITSMLTHPAAMVWEVWPESGSEFPVGLMYLTRIHVGCDATCHYIFFDGKLKDKTGILKQTVEWCFRDHPDLGWLGLRRLTVELPDYAFALARHANKHLGFGGPFEYKKNGTALHVEGVREHALRWRGEDRDLIIMGKMNERKPETDTDRLN